MANENRLIHGDVAQQRLAKLAEHYKGSFSGEAFERAAMEIASMPRVDAVEVEDKELLKAIKILVEQYGHSKRSEYVHSPVAHALYHTWKKVDEDGRRKERQWDLK